MTRAEREEALKRRLVAIHRDRIRADTKRIQKEADKINAMITKKGLFR